MDPAIVYPYFNCSAEEFERMCVGMTQNGKHQLANMLAHHCLPLQRDENGWILSRIDLAMKNQFWHIGNDGKLTYDYKVDRDIFCATYNKNMPIGDTHE